MHVVQIARELSNQFCSMISSFTYVHFLRWHSICFCIRYAAHINSNVSVRLAQFLPLPIGPSWPFLNRSTNNYRFVQTQEISDKLLSIQARIRSRNVAVKNIHFAGRPNPASISVSLFGQGYLLHKIFRAARISQDRKQLQVVRQMFGVKIPAGCHCHKLGLLFCFCCPVSLSWGCNSVIFQPTQLH